MQYANKRILYIAYPLLTVSAESAGGAEQMLWTLEREMARRGTQTTVAASAGSRVSGALFSTGEPCSLPDDFERRNREHQEKVIQFVAQSAREGKAFDLIHDKSGSFWPHACEVDVPVLATLHLPRSFYPPQSFQHVPENVTFNCVSESQAASFRDLPALLGVAPNGIALDPFLQDSQCGHGDRYGLLWLGRICEEKAPHLALEIASQSGLPITLAGQVYPFSYHQLYFEREVAPRLRAMPEAAFVVSPSAGLKCSLLRKAHAILITSQVDETSSLVAMEAAASGTPVIAFRRGALAEVVREGVTGFLVDSTAEAVAALRRVKSIDPVACVQHARENFRSAAMAGGYTQLYERVMQRARSRQGVLNLSVL